MTMIVSLTMLATAWADPCGMVPPIWTGAGPPQVAIERTGLQQTYVFYRDGVQTIAIRPGFAGSVEEFGMLVPLPAVPALRKIDDRVFDHLKAAVDPPTVQVIIQHQPRYPERMTQKSSGPPRSSPAREMELDRNEVRVLKEEAVGMYEVAVLEAGSSKALQRWMDDHDFRYPDGMDETVEDYVALRWMFVAIKARVGAASGVTPSPGMRSVDNGLPSGASFDGYVQGMAFRFEIDEPVVPMRLAVFNGEDTHNRMYVFTETPIRVDEVSERFVRRQIRGTALHDNLTELLPMAVQGGSIRSGEQDQVDASRSPDPFVVAARDLFAADLMAVATGTLSLPFEEKEKELLRINEALLLRGAQIDSLVQTVVADIQANATRPALADVYEMSLTVVDGNFPADVLADENLTFARYDMPKNQNRKEVWSDLVAGPTVYLWR